MVKVGVIGCGAWGTTLAKILVENNHNVQIWCHDAVIENQINNMQVNSLLPGIPLSKELQASTDLESVIQNSECIVLAVASQYISLISKVENIIEKKPLICVVKGLYSDKENIFISDYISSFYSS